MSISPLTLRTIVCLFLVYLSWGSCYIGIKFALESFPPFLLCGLRLTTAGFLLYGLTWLRGERALPSRTDVTQSLILAFFMVLISSGCLSKAQESVPSGTAAMVSGTVPLWMVLAGWLVYHEPRPTLLQGCGLLGGTLGLIFLGARQGMEGITSPFGLFILLCGALGWVVGSFYSKRHASETHLSVMQNSGLLMFFGGLQATLLGLLLGERVSLAAVTSSSWAAMIFLIFFGAIVGYSTYFWLLLHTRTVVAISYEYVNPVIGVFLGWLFGGETVDATVVLACCAVVGSVFFVISDRHD